MLLIWGRRQADFRKSEYHSCDRMARRATLRMARMQLCRRACQFSNTGALRPDRRSCRNHAAFFDRRRHHEPSSALSSPGAVSILKLPNRWSKGMSVETELKFRVPRDSLKTLDDWQIPESKRSEQSEADLVSTYFD